MLCAMVGWGFVVRVWEGGWEEGLEAGYIVNMHGGLFAARSTIRRCALVCLLQRSGGCTMGYDSNGLFLQRNRLGAEMRKGQWHFKNCRRLDYIHIQSQ